MKMNWYWMVILALVLLTAAAYLYSGPRPGFDELYASVITLNKGHFPYLNIPGKYNNVLKKFLK